MIDVTVDTGRVGKRREVRLQTIDDLADEADRIVVSAAAGKVRSLGNWSLAQVLWHIGRLIELSFDGFPFRYQRGPRWLLPALRLLSWRWLIAMAFRPGFRNPPEAAVLEPAPSLPLGRGRRIPPPTVRAYPRRGADDKGVLS
jgi:hypothetical protein